MKTNHKIASRAEWLAARTALLAEEKQLTRQMDAVAAKRRALPWVKIDKDYRFNSGNGRVSLADLFGGKSQLVIQHFMLGPGWEEGCPSCSYMADHTDGMLPHLAARDVMMLAVSRAPLAEIDAFKKRMGWHFDWVSSNSSDFNYDFHVSFTEEEIASGKVDYNFTMQPFGSTEAPGISVFEKDDDGTVYHTYSVYGRGVELMMGTYRILDLLPKGRDEDDLEFTMAWVRHHDRYDSAAGKCGCHSEEAKA
ncbi:MAG: thioredoxin family protein [Chthoniobacteraceae bacterium]